ncbi:response regulator transcription factor [Paenibacillus chitinolyticus]|uniref:response regulator transcription factor n=1 Tax=Paenibacillus chitinolyticus TaxID=79263 RepID=UPI001C48F867|nr:response regulator [Paenibacillus chitinolyticus]MBV6714767.1 response regulator [Paenibacillus chitinolyticus]
MHLLIVDDEPIIRKGLVKMAELYPFEFAGIHTAASGVAALEIIREHEIDLVFTDIRMPKMDGLELCRIIHEQYSHIPCIVISGFGDFSYAQKCLFYGVKHYLLKPVTAPDLHEVLADFMKNRVKGFVALSDCVDVIEQMEQLVWNLEEDRLRTLIGEWKQNCLSSGMNMLQLRQLIKECMALLLKRLQARGLPVKNEWEDKRCVSKEQIFEQMQARLKDIMEKLLQQRSGTYKNLLDEVKTYIDTHLAEEITLDEVAEMAGFTPTYFSSMFKKMTNETFVKYRIKKRMEKAQQLLAIPHIRIVDVAAKVGYEDYPHFTKMFKKTTGYSPSEYRQQLGIK